MALVVRVLLALSLGCLLTGCFGSDSHKGETSAIRTVLASDWGVGVGELFPAHTGSVSCAIPRGGPAIVYISGKCATVVKLVADGSAVVKFVETWDGRAFRGQGSPARPGLSHTWEFKVSRSRRVSRPRQYGDFPPQMVV